MDVDLLQQELQDIDRERYAVEERLREYSARGRGRGGYLQRQGPGRGGGPPRFGRGAGSAGEAGPSGPLRTRIPSFNDRPGNEPHSVISNGRAFPEGTGTPRSERRGSFERHGSFGEPSPHAPGRSRDGRFGTEDGWGPDAITPLPGPPGLPEKKKVLSSAIVVGDTQLTVGETTAVDDAPGIAKRPRDELDDNPAMKKRNKRMFGALLGTLQRFKEEDAAARKSRIAQQREEALKRADAHAAEELQRAREHERQQAAQQRIAELNRKRELNAAAELKKMEIALAKRYTHQAALHRFLCTAAKPALLWMPAKHCADTILLEEQRQLDLRVWMDNEKAKLEEQRIKVIDRTKAIIEQAEKTRNSAVPGLPSAPSGAAVNGHAEEAAADEKEEEDHHDGDGADEPMADTEEADAVPSHKAAEQEQGANPEDRYDGTDAGQQNCGDREEEPEEDAGDDHEVDFGDEKLAETVEDLLK